MKKLFFQGELTVDKHGWLLQPPRDGRGFYLVNTTPQSLVNDLEEEANVLRFLLMVSRWI